MKRQQNIIIIEDNETFSLLVTHYLKNNIGNAHIYAENSGAKAIASIRRLKPSLVVLDYYLENELSAKDVMKVINGMTNKPKVILLSSITDEAEKREVMAMGIEHFVPKSNESFYDLIRVIEQILERQKDESAQHRGLFKFTSSTAILLLAAIIAVALLIAMMLG